MIPPDLEATIIKAKQDCVDLYSLLKRIRTEWGYGSFDYAVKQINRERLLNPDRDKRKRPSRGECQRLYDSQKGICPRCGDHLFVPANDKGNEVDHIDPNRQDFNHRSNKVLVHGLKCNRSKGAQSIQEQSKRMGKSFTDILQPGIDNAAGDEP